jgi:two-component system, NarL family, sensor kinase
MFCSVNYIDIFIIGSLVTLLLSASFAAAIIISQRKKARYIQGLQLLKEQQQNQLIESAVRSEENERHRIAEQLHDEIGALLSSAKLHVAGIGVASLSVKEADFHNKAKALLDEAIQKLRTISHNLHSSILKEFGLAEAIRHFVENTSGHIVKADVQLANNCTPSLPDNAITTYRLMQELLQNILKHAHPTNIHIAGSSTNEQLDFEITHDGQGILQADFETLRYNNAGMGLKNIQNRLILLKADIKFDKTTAGYTIKIRIPNS